ncbi:MAG: transporter substrate-binding domain-containing protein [Synergistaceae bacterium]|nr:transporter substrate-binding domain-containing protein [Synergistaceae bacterium]
MNGIIKKFLGALILVLVLCSVSFAAESPKIEAGLLTYLGTTEDEFQVALDELRKSLAPLLPSNDENDPNGGWVEGDRLEGFILDLAKTRRVVHFYNSLLEMQMALRARKIDEVNLPEAVGMYLISNNTNYEVKFSLNMMPSTISFGFKAGNTKLQKEFNTAINAMRKDGTLKTLATKYINTTREPAVAKFTNFKGAETIKVAVTGDLPPIDYIAADGRPTGYNTAILSEIGKRIKKNIRLISVDAGGRSAALASDRADVVFWYRSTEGLKLSPKNAKILKGVMKDSHEGVILSVPYYEWDTDLVIGRAN